MLELVQNLKKKTLVEICFIEAQNLVQNPPDATILHLNFQNFQAKNIEGCSFIQEIHSFSSTCVVKYSTCCTIPVGISLTVNQLFVNQTTSPCYFQHGGSISLDNDIPVE